MKKKILKIIGLIIVFLLMLIPASKLVKWKHSDSEYKIFYEKPKDFDVLFFGASVVHYAVYPMQLWNNYGITSYNMGNDSEKIFMSYYDMINAFDYASPKLVVFDLTAIGWAGAKRDGTLKDHAFLDSVPLSKNKIKEINAVFEGKERLEYILPFELYHSRWSELTDEDFYFNHKSYEYGAERHDGFVPFPRPSIDMYEESREADVYLEYDTIKKIIALCEERNIDLIFTYFPSAHRGGDQKVRKACGEMMSEFDYPYYDFWDLDFIDWSCDTVEGAHLNYYGGEKITDYIGKMLSEEYNVPNRKNDTTINASWNADYEQYIYELDFFINETIDEYNAAKSAAD